MEQGDDSRTFFRSPTFEADPGQVALPSPPTEHGQRIPMPSPAKVKEELINLHLEMWLSKGEELPALEVALKVVNIDLSSPALFRTADIQPACALPLPGGTYYFVPMVAGLDSVPPFTKFKAWRIELCLRNCEHAVLFHQVTKLLDEDIRSKFPNLEQYLARMTLDKKAAILARYLLENGKVPTNHLNKFKIGVCDIDEDGKFAFSWGYLDWECTFDEVISALDNHSRSSHVPAVALRPYVRHLESLAGPRATVSFTAMLASELLADIRPIVNNEDDVQIQRGDAPFAIVWEHDTLLRLAYPGYSKSFADYDEMSPDPMPRDLDLFQVKSEQEFIRYKNLARATQMCPILVRPWQFRCFELLTRARDIAEC